MVQDSVCKAEIVTDTEAAPLVKIATVAEVRKLQTMAGRRKNNPKAERLFLRALTRQLNK